MNELSNIGFVYDLTHFDPKGNEVEHQRVHNLIPNEGIKWMLGKVFTPENIFQYNTKYSALNYLILGLMKALHTPNKFDTLRGTNEYFDEPDATTDLYYYNKSLDRKVSNDKITNTVTFDMTGNYYGYYGYQFKNPTLITGVFVYKQNEGGQKYTERCGALLSEAMLPTPIYMEKDGVLDIKCGFTMVSL